MDTLLLDVRSLFFAGAITTFYMSIVLVLYGREQKMFPGYRYWLVAQFLYFGSYFFFSLRGILPDFLSIVVANTLSIAASTLRLEGVKRFAGQEKFWWPNLLYPTSMFIVYWYFSAQYDSVLVRNTFSAIVGTILCLQIVKVLLKIRVFKVNIWVDGFIGLLLAYAVVLLVRAVLFFLIPEIQNILANHPLNLLFATLALLFDMSWPLFYILLNGQKARQDILDLTVLLEKSASIDALTGVYNRRKFIELSEQELARARRYGHSLSLVMFDLDRFKDVNDTFGHAAGDDVLKQVSSVCKQNLRETDILGRLGGDEFVILLVETDDETALNTAKRLEEKVLGLDFSWKHEVRVGFSYGIAALQPEDADIDSLMARADAMLYEMKARRHNRSPILR
jgi:diguanylate cyclase (GGDEF)-like protein